MFSKLLGDLAGKIAIGSVVVLAILCIFLFLSGKSKEHEITQLSNSVAELSNRNSVLESQVENCKKQFEAAMAAKQIQQDVIDRMNEYDRTTMEELNKLNNVIEGVANGEVAKGRSALSPDLVRLLNEHCNKIRGSNCSNP